MMSGNEKNCEGKISGTEYAESTGTHGFYFLLFVLCRDWACPVRVAASVTSLLQLGRICNQTVMNTLLSGKTLALKQIRADTSHEVSALLVIFVLQNTINNHGQR